MLTNYGSGFRSRVFVHMQNQNRLTDDGTYTVPEGVEFKYVSSCAYDSKSSQINSEAEYKLSLSKEANIEESTREQTSVFMANARGSSNRFSTSSSNTEGSSIGVSAGARAKKWNGLFSAGGSASYSNSERDSQSDSYTQDREFLRNQETLSAMDESKTFQKSQEYEKFRSSIISRGVSMNVSKTTF